jgi:hypothetical protein
MEKSNGTCPGEDSPKRLQKPKPREKNHIRKEAKNKRLVMKLIDDEGEFVRW